MKKDNSFEVVRKKKMKENDCLVKKKCKNECATISETEILAIFNKYWYELNDYNRKRDYLLSCMEKAPIKRTYVLHTSNRSSTYRYFVSVDNVEKEVCRKFILSTLDISEKLLRYTRDNKIDLYVSKHDNRGKQPSKNKTANVIIGNVDRFIQMLPAVPSHYCRGSSSKKYITNDFNSLEHVYRVYIEDYFLDWSEVCKTMFNRPKLKDTDGCDVKFKKIRTVYFNKEYLNNFKIAYSFKHNDDNNIILDYKNVSITENRSRSKLKNVEPKQLYFSKLPITETKYKDLKQLCTKKTIPDKFHSEYLEIPFKATIRDELAETDEED
ncbi:hypothetical protein ACI65C_001737 [Semiaphis heraclei]